MIELVHTLAPKEPLDISEVSSFRTATYVGIWDHQHNQYILLPDEEESLFLHTVPSCETYAELDQKVFDEIEEHILSVSDRSDYSITLEA